jgi:spermidine/putrescine transport system ATP-binding protein
VAEPAIALSELGKRYGSTVAVEGVSLSIARGEFFALLGPSGCGKTTTLRMVAGFEVPTSGVIRLGGMEVGHLPPHRRNVNTVFQNFALFPHLSVWDNVAFGPRSRRLSAGEVRRRVGEVLERVRLSELAARHPHQLSGGQQQRVALARALVNEPAALLLDEPLSALDPGLRRAMQAELRRLQRDSGIAFLLVTHDRDEALALSDRLAVMRAGRIEQIGTPRQVYDTPATAFVAAFIGGVNLLPASPVTASDAGRRMLRPERLRLRNRPPRDGEEGLAVQVNEVTFRGPLREVSLRTAAGEELVAHQQRCGDDPPIRSGDRLWAVWDPTAVHRLPEAPPS